MSKLLSIREVADRLGKGISTIHDLINKKRLVTEVVGNRHLVREDALENINFGHKGKHKPDCPHCGSQRRKVTKE